MFSLEITIDPNISFGRPCVADTGIPADNLNDLFVAGDSIDDIAADFGLERAQVEAAIRYEYWRTRRKRKNKKGMLS